MHNIHRPLEPRSGRGAFSGEMITFGKRKDRGTGYLARSERVGPGVLLLHEFFGLTDSFKEMADRLNEAGFTVLAPDLYDGVIAKDVEEAKAMAESLDHGLVLARLEAAADLLVDNWHPRLGVVGFSLGGFVGTILAGRRDLEALVLYYSLGELDPHSRPPVLGHFAEDDDWEPAEDARQLFAKWAVGEAPAEFHLYPGTGHWFANPAVADAYNAEAAKLAWSRTVDFLTHHLA